MKQSPDLSVTDSTAQSLSGKLWRRGLPTAILLAAWALRVHSLGAKSLWYDELRQIEVAQQPLSQFEPLLIVHAARPLDYAITHYWLLGAGAADGPAGRVEFWLRFPAALWSMLAMAVFWPLARRWLSRPAAAAGLALMAAAPLGVQYAQELRPYALYLLLALLSFYALDHALALGPRGSPGQRRRAWLGFGLASAAGALTHFFYLTVLAVQGLFVLGLWVFELARRSPARRRHVSGRGLLAFGACAAAAVAALFVDYRPDWLGFWVGRFVGALVGAPAAGGLVSDTGVAVTSSTLLNANFFLRDLLPFFGAGEGPALAAFVGLVLVGLAALARRDGRRAALAALWLVAGPGLVIVYLQYRQQFFALRYILYGVPIYLLLAAGGLAAIAGAVRRWRAGTVRLGSGWALRAGPAVFGLGLALLLGWQLGRLAGYYRAPKGDYRRVGQFLTLNTRPGDTLGAPDVQAFIRFYAPHQAAVIVDANDLGPHQQALANGERFWFVLSDYTLRPVEETRGWATDLRGVTIQLDPSIKVIFVHPGLTQEQMLAEAATFVAPPPSLP